MHDDCIASLTAPLEGIRAGSGNVMLYGPAGTGKTIMCQAAAFEAKADLIIGTSLCLHLYPFTFSR